MTSQGTSMLTADARNPRLVLNVEDFPPTRFLRSRILRNAGFEVVEAGMAREALAAVTTRLPALVLVDVDLPDADGFSVCETLNSTHPDLPVLLVSAVHVSASAAHRGRSTGAVGFLREPVAADVLVSRVMDALQGIRDEASLNWVVTDSAGVIIEASGDAAQMLGLTAAHLPGRLLLNFFDCDRPEWSRALALAHADQVVERGGWVKPRERRRLSVAATITRAVDYPQPRSVLWSFRRLPAAS